MQRAEGEAAAVKARAEADKFAAEQESAGMTARLAAQAADLQQLLAAAPPDVVKFYLALEKGLFSEVAQQTASAVSGMQPKINVWTTGAGGGEQGAADAMAPMRNLFTSLPPMLEALGTQTDVKMPSWLPQHAAQVDAGEGSAASPDTEHALPASS